MIIDFHTHTFPDFLAPKVIPKLEQGAQIRAFVDGTEKDLLASMRQSGVDLSIVLPVATTFSQVVTCNNCAQAMNENIAYQGKFLSFGAMHPDYENYREELLRIRDNGIRGIKLHPDYQKTAIDDIKYKRIIDCASEFGLITLIHSGLDIGLPDPIHALPDGIYNLIHDVKPEKLVLAHMGGFHLWQEVMEKLSGEDVYLDTAFSLGDIQYLEECPNERRLYRMMKPELFIEMVEAFGVERILFATDSPWGGQKETLEIFQSLPLTSIQKRKILGENAEKLLGLVSNKNTTKNIQ